VVALHLAMASVVPAAPRRHDSLVTLGLCIGLSLAVWAVMSPEGAARLRSRTVALVMLSTVALAFAELAKEIGYVGLLLVLPTMLAACYGAGV
jgi:hypothetical protein